MVGVVEGEGVVATILIIEDNDDNRDVLVRYLRLMGYTTIVATNGADGVMRAQFTRPDLILLDLNLPQLDGWGTASQLKQQPATQSIPIIAVTAHALLDDRDRALAAGCDDYEPKPIDLPLLLQKVQAYLHRQGPMLALTGGYSFYG
jgi:CheY-like chemotaxis protein